MPDEAFYRNVFDLFPNGLLILDKDGVILEGNKKAFDLLGSDFTERRIDEVLGKEQASPGVVERGGQKPRFKASSFTGPKEGGEDFNLVILEPISEAEAMGAKNLKTRLEDERALFMEVFENAHEGMCLFGASGRLYLTNEAYAGVLGYAKEELMSDAFDWSAIVALEDRELVQRNIEEVLKAGEPRHYEAKFVKKDGSLVRVMVSESRLGATREEWPETIMLETIYDITQLRQAQAKLVVEKECLDAILATTQEGVVIVDSEGSIFYANNAYCELTGRTRKELLEHGWRITVSPEEHETIATVDRRIEQALSSTETTFSNYVRQDGTLRHTRRVSRAIPWDGKRRVLVSISDITEIKEAQEKLKELIEAQQSTIKELSTPVIPVWTRILMAPLLGSFDSGRMRDLSERLLQETASQNPRAILLDLSGLANADTQVVAEILSLIISVRLLGAKTILSGIKPRVAQSLIRLGANLEWVSTHATLEQGLRHAIAGFDTRKP